MKVLAFIDDCGHMTAFDMSTPEQELKIIESICKEAAKANRIDADEKKQAKDLIANKKIDELYEFLSDKDVIHIGQRGGPDVIDVQKEWSTGLLDF